MPQDHPDWQPTLASSRVALRPLREADFEALHAAASDPLIWAQHSETTRHEREVFRRFFDGALAGGGALVAVEPASGRLIGSSRYYDWNPADRSVVIGYTFLERSQWGRGVNAQMKSLMLAHAFRWASIAWFHVSPGNLRSRRALERIGARFDHEAVVPVGGVPSPRVIYRIDRP
jgi:RimJ/RimL family protein N-acetyltransferase